MPALIIPTPKLVTAEFLYYMPDYRHILQSLTLQSIDYPPKYPGIKKFINFWHRECSIAPLYMVRIGEVEVFKSDYRFPDHTASIN